MQSYKKAILVLLCLWLESGKAGNYSTFQTYVCVLMNTNSYLPCQEMASILGADAG
jgi:hypothetical protein